MKNKNNHLKRYHLTVLDKVNICLDSIGDHAFHFVLMFDTQLDLKRLQRAVRLSLVAEPMYATRFVNHWWEPYWEEWNPGFLDRYNYCELDETTEDVEQGIMDFFLEKMDASLEPFVKLKVFRKETDTLCFNINCVVADGFGMGGFIFQILTIYNRLADDPDFMPRPSDPTLRSSRTLISTLKIWDLIKLPYLGARNHFANKKTAHNWEFPFTNPPEMKKTIIYRRFQRGFIDKLNRYRKSLGASVNDVMLGAYYKALFDIIKPDGDKPYCVLNTYDLRKYLPPEGRPGVANYSSYINTNINITPDMVFEDIVKQVNASITEQKRGYPGLSEAPYVLLLFAALPWALARLIFQWLIRTRGGNIPVFTNAGTFDLRLLKVDGVPVRDGYPIGPLLYPPKLTVGLASTGMDMFVALGFSENHFKRDDVDRLFELMENIVTERADALESA